MWVPMGKEGQATAEHALADTRPCPACGAGPCRPFQGNDCDVQCPVALRDGVSRFLARGGRPEEIDAEAALYSLVTGSDFCTGAILARRKAREARRQLGQIFDPERSPSLDDVS